VTAVSENIAGLGLRIPYQLMMQKYCKIGVGGLCQGDNNNNNNNNLIYKAPACRMTSEALETR